MSPVRASASAGRSDVPSLPLPEGALRPVDVLRTLARQEAREAGAVFLLWLGAGLGALIVVWALAREADANLVVAGSAALVGALALEAAARQAAMRLEGRWAMALERGLWDRALRLAPSRLRVDGGRLASRLGEAVGAPAAMVALLRGAAVALVGIACAAILLGIDAVAAAACASGLLAGLAVHLVFSGRAAVVEVRARELAEEAGERIDSALRGLATLRLAGREHAAMRDWQVLRGEARAVAGRAALLRTWASAAVVSCSLLGLVVAMAVVDQGLPGPSRLALALAVAVALREIAPFSDALEAWAALRRLGSRIAPPLAATERGERGGRLQPRPGPLGFAVRDVGFSYPGARQPVLEDASLDVEPGSITALVGVSGSGKSTMVRLLLGFERAERGSILVRGSDCAAPDRRETPLEETDLDLLRARVGAVLSGQELGRGSLADLIAGAGAATLEDAWRAARLAGLAPLLEVLPMGLHTPIGDGLLSNAQRLQVLIARALVHRPDLVVLDEATAGLDAAGEEALLARLRSLGTTVLLVTHRPSAVRHADRVYRIENGCAVRVEGAARDRGAAA